jgi:16S rRNA (cytosine967-C5)-methyltransferase
VLETQRLATNIVTAVIDDGRNLNATLAKVLARHPQLVSRQRAAITDLAYGTLRFGMALESTLDQLLTAPLRDKVLRRLLLVALYQLQYTRAAPHAIVDHAVRCAAALGAPYAKSLVNAVLRNFLRQREALFAKPVQKETAHYAYPQWWIDKLRTQYPQHYAAVLLAGNEHPPFTLRVNCQRITRDAYLALLAQHEIAAIAVGDYGVKLERALPIEQVPGFSEGLVSVQDAGAQAAAPLLDVRDGMRVLDACAAPGGKTTHLLELANLDLVALDNDQARLERVQQNLTRLKFDARLVCGDVGCPENWWDGRPFERILADVPCSASGVVRRHPDIKWLRRAADIAQFMLQQRLLLDAMWRLLGSGGKLLYTTCSVFQEENAQQIADFLAHHPDARLLPWSGTRIPGGVPEGQLLPDYEHDGFFYALLQKN